MQLFNIVISAIICMFLGEGSDILGVLDSSLLDYTVYMVVIAEEGGGVDIFSSKPYVIFPDSN